MRKGCFPYSTNQLFSVRISKPARVCRTAKEFKLWQDKWPKLTQLTMPSVGEDMGSLELSFIVGGRVNWYNSLGNLLDCICESRT